MSTPLKQTEADLKRLKLDLTQGSYAVVRKASAHMLTDLAEQARDQARINISDDFVLRKGREKWTLDGVRSTFANPRQDIEQQFSMVGAKNFGGRINPMGRQEEGGALPATSHGKRRLTTGQGARQGDRPTPRTQVATGRYDPRRLKVEPHVRGKGMSRAQRMILTVRKARAKGGKLVKLKLPGDGKVGIFAVRGSKSDPEIKMVHRIYKRSLRIKPKPWLEPAIDKVTRDGEALGLRWIAYETIRARLFEGSK